jgi:hypothetical protein
MRTHYHLGSVTRIADLEDQAFDLVARPRADWRWGDYVVGEVLEAGPGAHVEWPDGHLTNLVPGDQWLGALGSRCATLELVGDWRDVGSDLQMHSLSAAGVFGRCTSRATFTPAPVCLRYAGHVCRGGEPLRMGDYAARPRATGLDLPVVQVIGTSMECGKTTAAQAVIRRLTRRGLGVAGAKLTGVARCRDILGMRAAGATFVLDFVDVGLPSTLVPPEEFTDHVDRLLGLLADQPVDIAVVEAGASPMEPYNGAVAIERLRPHARLTLLAASDLYAVLGAVDHLGVRADAVVGRVASTSAGVAIVQQQTGVPAFDPLAAGSAAVLDELLDQLGLQPRLAVGGVPD